MTYLFPLLLLAMGIYVLYGAITGKGRLFSLENVKDEEKDRVKKILRLLYVALAVIMFLTAVVSFGQTVLYSTPVSYYETTEQYSTDFADIIKDGKVTYEEKAYTVAGEHDVSEMNALLMAANAAHPDKFTSEQSSSMFSCMGSSETQNKIAQYYKETKVTDAAGKQVYQSTIGSVRSDANDGSFLSKLYGAFSDTLLRILSYVFMGLAVVGVVALFVIIRKFTDKEKEAKARATVSQPSMPSSAFNFDDEEKNEK